MLILEFRSSLTCFTVLFQATAEAMTIVEATAAVEAEVDMNGTDGSRASHLKQASAVCTFLLGSCLALCRQASFGLEFNVGVSIWRG